MKNKKSSLINAFIVIALSLFICTGCNKTDIAIPQDNKTPEETKEDSSSTSGKVRFLGHKGAGSNNYNDLNMEHSIASIEEALKVLDGVEVDLQMSLDGTIWMFHDVDINASLCTPGAPRSILTMHDKEIAELKLCSRTKKDRVYRLSEMMTLWNATPHGFYISMEIKEDFDSATYDSIGGRPAYLRKLADQLALELKVLNHPADQFLIEEHDRIFPDAFSKYPVGKKVKYFVFEYKSFDNILADALAMGFDGISCNFEDETITAEKIKAAQKKGIFVQIWTPYYDAEVLKVYQMHPNSIQTDHTNVKTDLGIK
jgi:glycerophosphoryl diester phosphodiesterase